MQFLNINLVITIEEKNSMSGQGCVELQYKYLDQKNIKKRKETTRRERNIKQTLVARSASKEEGGGSLQPI